MKPQFDYQGSNVFVAGGTTGINFGIASAFADAGAQLGVASRKQENVDAAISKLSGKSSKASGYVMDVRNPDQVDQALTSFAEMFGKIDVLVSGAAGNFLAPATQLSPNGFKTVVDIDLLGTFHVMKAAYPHMKKPGGSIINISAPQAARPMPMQIHACAAKAGVDMITRCLALEWGPEGLRINGVSPGPIAGTEGMKRLAPTREIEDKIAKSVPARRFGTLEDVSSVCLFLGSEVSGYINGEIISADGGWTMSGAHLSI